MNIKFETWFDIFDSLQILLDSRDLSFPFLSFSLSCCSVMSKGVKF